MYDIVDYKIYSDSLFYFDYYITGGPITTISKSYWRTWSIQSASRLSIWLKNTRNRSFLVIRRTKGHDRVLVLESTRMNDGKDNKTHNVANLERMHGITDDMETEEDTIDMAMTERFIFLEHHLKEIVDEYAPWLVFESQGNLKIRKIVRFR